MYNGAETENRDCLINGNVEEYKFFVHKDYFNLDVAAKDYMREVENGNLVVVRPDGSVLKSDHIGVGYFKSNFTLL
jgi:hypothetical protein